MSYVTAVKCDGSLLPALISLPVQTCQPDEQKEADAAADLTSTPLVVPRHAAILGYTDVLVNPSREPSLQPAVDCDAARVQAVANNVQKKSIVTEWLR
eukprot:m.454781 g.454781  ORF g.454781 m.454781 type:complete len:98 (-) comp21570_c0_seq29:176-469(-)